MQALEAKVKGVLKKSAGRAAFLSLGVVATSGQVRGSPLVFQAPLAAVAAELATAVAVAGPSFSRSSDNTDGVGRERRTSSGSSCGINGLVLAVFGGVAAHAPESGLMHSSC